MQVEVANPNLRAVQTITIHVDLHVSLHLHPPATMNQVTAMFNRFADELRPHFVQSTVDKYIAPESRSFQTALAAIIAAPLIWNVLARSLRPFVKSGSKRLRYGTCYAVTVWIFSFSCFRDHLSVEQINGDLAASDASPSPSPSQMSCAALCTIISSHRIVSLAASFKG